LINPQMVESVRREYKKSWSAQTLEQIVHTICAFANDYYNLNGGYIIVGIEERDGLPVLPPAGLNESDLDEIQKQIRGQCKRIDPEYQPLLYPDVYQQKHILVVWAPAGDVRPYQATIKREGGEKAYYVRIGAETTRAQTDVLNQLLERTAKVPFDDRRNLSAPIEALSPTLVRNFLVDIHSDLVSPGVNISDPDLFRYLRISTPVNEHEAPKNVGLLFFSNNPEQFFPGTRIEIVQFGDDAGGDLIEEKPLRGPLHHQIRQAMNENGSPEPIFDFDKDRSYFRVTLPAHPQYIIIHALRESSRFWFGGERARAIANGDQ
jgi:ATP-dependent DNA helicase RecG